MFDLISIGDSVIDTFLKLHDAEVKCSINRKDCKICMNYGDKIPLDGPPISMVAGNAANNAVGGSRLGLKTAIYVNVGEDDGGERTIKKLKMEKIDTRYVVVNKGMENNYHTVLNFQGERTGSGDAFATGTLAGLFHGKDLPEAMRWGAANGASVVEQIGPQAGLLTYSQMQEKLKANSKIVAKEI